MNGPVEQPPRPETGSPTARSALATPSHTSRGALTPNRLLSHTWTPGLGEWGEVCAQWGWGICCTVRVTHQRSR